MSPDPHSASADLGYASVGEVLDWLDSGEVTSELLLNTLHERVRALEEEGPALHAIAGLDERALEEARRLDDERRRGERRGPLHGVPVLVKDNIEALGLPGLAGSTSLENRPSADSTLVRRLREAGALVWGSTNLSEWANIRSSYSTSGWSATGGLVANPWALDRSAGGSSSGSGAAMAAGYGPLAIGTETDGSITCPASLNGVAGLKPTVGAVSRDGVVPISHSQDSPGPLARDVDSLSRALEVLLGRAREVPERVRFSRAQTWHTGHPGTDVLLERVLDDLGRDLDLLDTRPPVANERVGEDELTVLLCELHDDLSAYLAVRPGEGPRSLAEVIRHEDTHAGRELAFFGHDLLERSLATGGRAHPDYAGARERNLAWARETLETALGEGDVALSGAYAPAWKSDLVNGDHPAGVSSAIQAAAIAGWPILSLPAGLVGGLPVGLTLVARAGEEWALLEAARHVEQLVAPVGRPTWTVPGRG